jgi:ankyrin repeat protein
MPDTGFFFAAATAAAALFAAIDANDREAVDRLLAGDPKLASARDDDGVSAVANAAFLRRDRGFVCTHDNPVLASLLARAPALDVFDAALVGDSGRVAALVAQDPKLVAARAKLGWTPLHFAAFGGSVATVKLLLARGAALEERAQTRFRNTALQIALLCGEAPVVTHLLERGANANVRQNLDFRPLHEAALLGRVDLIEVLLAHGAEINARTEGGETPLGTAVRTGKPKAAEYLRARGGTE